MRKRLLISFIVMSFLLILTACGDSGNAAKDDAQSTADNPEVGLNKITLDALVQKKENNEAFYVLMFDAKKEYVKNTKLIDAYNKALKERDMKAYYINLHDLSYDRNQKLKSLREAFDNKNSGHSPFADGGMTVVHHGKISSPFAYFGKAWLLNTTIGEKGNNDESFLKKSIYKDVKEGIQLSLDYVNENKIDMSK
ncbi:hypothetical protein [Virgibacillus ihumii]|uniref:hypothetical protein n=1 Tax=Virgibacillus ihumii TaxID=2686091 RepID=UPI00157C518F|nr:hypothetical protein [Virgibacillus ihumii]